MRLVMPALFITIRAADGPVATVSDETIDKRFAVRRGSENGFERDPSRPGHPATQPTCHEANLTRPRTGATDTSRSLRSQPRIGEKLRAGWAVEFVVAVKQKAYSVVLRT